MSHRRQRGPPKGRDRRDRDSRQQRPERRVRYENQQRASTSKRRPQRGRDDRRQRPDDASDSDGAASDSDPPSTDADIAPRRVAHFRRRRVRKGNVRNVNGHDYNGTPIADWSDKMNAQVLGYWATNLVPIMLPKKLITLRLW